MHFTVTWNDHFVPVWNKLIAEFKPTKILEIGSYDGCSACHFIKNASELKEIFCIDPWTIQYANQYDLVEDVRKRFDDNTAEALQGTNAKLNKIKGPSHLGLPWLLTNYGKGYFDLIYVDGSHDAPDVLYDACLSFHLLREGGVMVFDDYTWLDLSRWDVLSRPKIAVDAFANIMTYRMMMLVVDTPRQMYFVKFDQRTRPLEGIGFGFQRT